jgi:hypothetical protein
MEMNTQAPVDVERVFHEHVAIERALQEAYLDAIDNHIRFGVPMVFWEDGKIVEVPPEKLPELKVKGLERLASMQ